jgi:hypothetical protein
VFLSPGPTLLAEVDGDGKLICADQSLSYIRVDLHAVGRNDDAERSVLQP